MCFIITLIRRLMKNIVKSEYNFQKITKNPSTPTNCTLKLNYILRSEIAFRYHFATKPIININKKQIGN